MAIQQIVTYHDILERARNFSCNKFSLNSETLNKRTTYDVLSEWGKEVDFLYSTLDKFIQNAQSVGNT